MLYAGVEWYVFVLLVRARHVFCLGRTGSEFRIPPKAPILWALCVMPIGTDLLILTFLYPTAWTFFGLNSIAAAVGIVLLLGLIQGKRWAATGITLASTINALYAGAVVQWLTYYLVFGDHRGLWGSVGYLGTGIFLGIFLPYAAISLLVSFFLMRQPRT